VLTEGAASDQHAKCIVTHILDTCRRKEGAFVSCPTPSETKDYAKERPARRNPQREADENCSMCYGTGWHITQRGGLTGAERCLCTGP